ncbi:unnamed protein product [Caenorhabditis bovis]|uniref:Metallo-beta-lactamase domain-containing protein n=1 Tax=Caenorhabditis bovis TaxID=2654633 RepID=A0A8S1EZQ8_9PELO|nr:unnamed protein product [Caenorhabditis bovis]
MSCGLLFYINYLPGSQSIFFCICVPAIISRKISRVPPINQQACEHTPSAGSPYRSDRSHAQKIVKPPRATPQKASCSSQRIGVFSRIIFESSFTAMNNTLVCLVAFIAILSAGTEAATTEQLRQWILNNRESLSGQNDIAGSILRLFGWGNEKSTEVPTTTTPLPSTTTQKKTKTVEDKSQDRDVCPFSAEPLVLAGDFAYCRPSSVGDCPVGFLCDQSFKLGRSICCRDTRRGIAPIGRPVPARPASRLPLSWSTVTPTTAPSRPITSASTRKAPWYIKDRTAWPVYNRVAPEKPAMSSSTNTPVTTTTTTTTTTTELPTTTTEATTTTTTTTTTAAPTTKNSWARLWTSTEEPKLFANVTVLQAGSVRPLKEGQAEAVGAITLINDNGYVVLIDTGSSSDTERLLHTMRFEAADLEMDTSSAICACCSPIRTRTVGLFIGIFDFLFHSLTFARSVQFLQHYGFNFFATAAVSSIGVLYSIHVLCILACWYGLARRKSSWLVPKIVLKITTVFLCVSLTLILAFFVSSNSPTIGNLIADGFNAEYYDHKAVIDMGCMVIVFVSAILSFAQAWLLILLVNIYRQIRAEELERLCERAIRKLEKRDMKYAKRRKSEARLAKESVTLDQIDSVVITHASPGHMGNMNFFAQKPILYHSMEYIGRHVTPTELKERPYRKLSTNVEVWKTPGHTQHDLSVLIHNVAGYGTMAVVGDLIPSEHLLSEKRDVMMEEGVWDAAIKRQNANLIVCMADWIVPGHGQPFRVLPHYRQKAGCTRLLAQRHLHNQV